MTRDDLDLLNVTSGTRTMFSYQAVVVPSPRNLRHAVILRDLSLSKKDGLFLKIFT